jgi:hypothetical protein
MPRIFARAGAERSVAIEVKDVIVAGVRTKMAAQLIEGGRA